MEALEPRRLFAGHFHAPPDMPAAPPPASDAPVHVALALPTTACVVVDGDAAPPGTSITDQPSVRVVETNPATVAEHPLEMMDPHGHFAGYDYEQIMAERDATPPPESLIAQFAGKTPVMVTSAARPHPSKNLTPSFVPANVPQFVPGPNLTPLAQTPTRNIAAGDAGELPALSVPITSVTPAARPLGDAGAIVPHSHGVLETIGAVMPAQAVLSNVEVSTETLNALTYAANGPEALPLVVSSQSLGGAVAYNFVHFNPGSLLNDAIAGFTNESAALPLGRVEGASSVRALAITAAVIGLDIALVGYCYRESRRARAARRNPFSAGGREIDLSV